MNDTATTADSETTDPPIGDDELTASKSSAEAAEKPGLVDRVLAGWSTFVAGAGAVGAALVGYELTKNLGKGAPSLVDHILVLVSIGTFAVGAALLLAIPILLTSRSSVNLAQVVELEGANPKWYKPWRDSRVVVGREVLYGHQDVRDFSEAMAELLKEARTRYWAKDVALKPPPGIRQRINVYIAQRETAIKDAAASLVAAASRRAIGFAIAGLLLTVVGYGNATFVTNQAMRRAELADRETATEAAFPALPSAVVVHFPDEAAAASVLGANVAVECWTGGRNATAYDLAVTPADFEHPARIVRVAFAATGPACPAVDGRVEPAWLIAPAGKVAEDDSQGEGDTEGGREDQGEGSAGESTATEG